MFSWISSKPNQPDASGVTAAPFKTFDPLKGGGGAAAFYSNNLNVTSGEHVKSAPSTSKTAAGSAAAFYAHLSRDKLQALAGADTDDVTEGAAAATVQAASTAVVTASESVQTQRGLTQCPGAEAMNSFLMAGRRQLVEGEAGTGTVTVVIATDHAELDSLVSSIAYSLLLHCKQHPAYQPSVYQASTADLSAADVIASTLPAPSPVFVPVINCARNDLRLKPHIQWLFSSSGILSHCLTFIDEARLSSLHHQHRLNIILLPHTHKPAHEPQGGTGAGASNGTDGVPAALKGLEGCITDRLAISEPCLTVSASVTKRISEEAPELGAITALARMLLAPMLLSSPSPSLSTSLFSSPLDGAMAAFLAPGARFTGPNVLFHTLRDKRFNQLLLSTTDLLQSDVNFFATGRVNTAAGGEVVNVAVGCAGISAANLIGKDPSFEAELTSFMTSHSLHLLVLSLTYINPTTKKMRVELIVASKVPSMLSSASSFLQSPQSGLSLKAIIVRGMPSWSKAYSQGNPSIGKPELEQLVRNFLEGKK